MAGSSKNTGSTSPSACAAAKAGWSARRRSRRSHRILVMHPIVACRASGPNPPQGVIRIRGRFYLWLRGRFYFWFRGRFSFGSGDGSCSGSGNGSLDPDLK
ncbi:protein of unknown function [Micropruina glycogenica]|uniref:Uncharacterized protein n=1 Tax=Micropruina glycogenica TaxID=75385 RepID=A0A2N9JEE9_9ACTN|nr:protein of unknown function [Micropruina glycogenica]